MIKERLFLLNFLDDVFESENFDKEDINSLINSNNFEKRLLDKLDDFYVLINNPILGLNINNLIKHLCSCYINMESPDANTYLLLKSTSFDLIKEIFFQNKYLVLELLKNYYKYNLTNKNQNISSNKDSLLKEKFAIYVNVKGLNERIRDDINAIADYIMLKFGTYDCFVPFFADIIRNENHLNDLDIYDEEFLDEFSQEEESFLLDEEDLDILDPFISELKEYREYLIRIMYCDLYEYYNACKYPLFPEDSLVIDNVIYNIVSWHIFNGDFTLSEGIIDGYDILYRMINTFVSLAADIEARKENRKSLSQKDIMVLKRHNPMMMLDYIE